jgi:hypothetical protein
LTRKSISTAHPKPTHTLNSCKFLKIIAFVKKSVPRTTTTTTTTTTTRNCRQKKTQVEIVPSEPEQR